jgi:HEAT repeat protein
MKFRVIEPEPEQYWPKIQASRIEEIVAKKIGSIVEHDTRLQKLLLQLTDGDYHVRKEAARELGQFQDLDVVKALIWVCGDYDPISEDPKVNWAAAASVIGLGKIAEDEVVKFIRSPITIKHERTAKYFLIMAMAESDNPKYIQCLLDIIRESIPTSDELSDEHIAFLLNAPVCGGALSVLNFLIKNKRLGQFQNAAIKTLQTAIKKSAAGEWRSRLEASLAEILKAK